MSVEFLVTEAEASREQGHQVHRLEPGGRHDDGAERVLQLNQRDGRERAIAAAHQRHGGGAVHPARRGDRDAEAPEVARARDEGLSDQAAENNIVDLILRSSAGLRHPNERDARAAPLHGRLGLGPPGGLAGRRLGGHRHLHGGAFRTREGLAKLLGAQRRILHAGQPPRLVRIAAPTVPRGPFDSRCQRRALMRNNPTTGWRRTKTTTVPSNHVLVNRTARLPLARRGRVSEVLISPGRSANTSPTRFARRLPRPLGRGKEPRRLGQPQGLARVAADDGPDVLVERWRSPPGSRLCPGP